jgi:hypothetical protein
VAQVNRVDFETGDLSQCVLHQGNSTADSSAPLAGIWSLKLDTSSVAAVANGVVGRSNTQYASLATGFFGFLFKLTLQSGEIAICDILDSAGVYQAGLHLNTNGNLVLYDIVGSPIATGATVLSLGTTYILQIQIGTGALGAFEVDINKALELTGNGNFGLNNVGGIALGGRNGSYQRTSYYDNVLIDDAIVPDPSPPQFNLTQINRVTFETGDFTRCFSFSGAAGRVSIDGINPVAGNFSLKLDTSAGPAIANAVIGLSQVSRFNAPMLFAAFLFRYTFGSGEFVVAEILNTTTGGIKCSLRLNTSTGVLRFYDINGVLQATGTTPVVSNVLYDIGIQAGTGTSAPYAVQINRNTEFSGTANLGTVNSGAIRCGSSGSYTRTCWYDNVTLDSAVFPPAGWEHMQDAPGNDAMAHLVGGATQVVMPLAQVPEIGEHVFVFVSLYANVDLSFVRASDNVPNTYNLLLSGNRPGAATFGLFGARVNAQPTGTGLTVKVDTQSLANTFVSTCVTVHSGGSTASDGSSTNSGFATTTTPLADPGPVSTNDPRDLLLGILALTSGLNPATVTTPSQFTSVGKETDGVDFECADAAYYIPGTTLLSFDPLWTVSLTDWLAGQIALKLTSFPPPPPPPAGGIPAQSILVREREQLDVELGFAEAYRGGLGTIPEVLRHAVRAFQLFQPVAEGGVLISSGRPPVPTVSPIAPVRAIQPTLSEAPAYPGYTFSYSNRTAPVSIPKPASVMTPFVTAPPEAGSAVQTSAQPSVPIVAPTVPVMAVGPPLVDTGSVRQFSGGPLTPVVSPQRFIVNPYFVEPPREPGSGRNAQVFPPVPSLSPNNFTVIAFQTVAPVDPGRSFSFHGVVVVPFVPPPVFVQAIGQSLLQLPPEPGSARSASGKAPVPIVAPGGFIKPATESLPLDSPYPGKAFWASGLPTSPPPVINVPYPARILAVITPPYDLPGSAVSYANRTPTPFRPQPFIAAPVAQQEQPIYQGVVYSSIGVVPVPPVPPMQSVMVRREEPIPELFQFRFVVYPPKQTPPPPSIPYVRSVVISAEPRIYEGAVIFSSGVVQTPNVQPGPLTYPIAQQAYIPDPGKAIYAGVGIVPVPLAPVPPPVYVSQIPALEPGSAWFYRTALLPFAFAKPPPPVLAQREEPLYPGAALYFAGTIPGVFALPPKPLYVQQPFVPDQGQALWSRGVVPTPQVPYVRPVMVKELEKLPEGGVVIVAARGPVVPALPTKPIYVQQPFVPDPGRVVWSRGIVPTPSQPYTKPLYVQDRAIPEPGRVFYAHGVVVVPFQPYTQSLMVFQPYTPEPGRAWWFPSDKRPPSINPPTTSLIDIAQQTVFITGETVGVAPSVIFLVPLGWGAAAWGNAEWGSALAKQVTSAAKPQTVQIVSSYSQTVNVQGKASG